MTVRPPDPFSPALLEARDEAPGVRAFRFASPDGFSFVPGQFLMFHFRDDPGTRRAYSLCSSPRDAARWFEVAVGMVGAFSGRLGALRPGRGAALAARGPFGKWTYDGSAAHAVLVSGGTGVAPFRAMCRHKADGADAGRITLCCSAKAPELLLFRGEYDAWRKAGVDVRPRVTQPASGWSGAAGRWTPEAVLDAAGRDPGAVYYLCGPNKMVAQLRAGLQALGVAPARIRTEKWGNYAGLI